MIPKHIPGKAVPIKDIKIIPDGQYLILKYRHVAVTILKAGIKNGFEPYKQLQTELSNQSRYRSSCIAWGKSTGQALYHNDSKTRTLKFI